MNTNFSRYYFALLAFFFLAALPLSCAKPRQKAVKPEIAAPTDWESLMIDVNEASETIEKGIRRQSDKEVVVQSIEQMKAAFDGLRGMKPPKGSADLFQQYIEAGQGILRDVQTQVEHSYWKRAEGSFARIKDLQVDIEKDFAPGLWSRIKLWNAR